MNANNDLDLMLAESAPPDVEISPAVEADLVAMSVAAERAARDEIGAVASRRPAIRVGVGAAFAVLLLGAGAGVATATTQGFWATDEHEYAPTSSYTVTYADGATCTVSQELVQDGTDGDWAGFMSGVSDITFSTADIEARVERARADYSQYFAVPEELPEGETGPTWFSWTAATPLEGATSDEELAPGVVSPESDASPEADAGPEWVAVPEWDAVPVDEAILMEAPSLETEYELAYLNAWSEQVVGLAASAGVDWLTPYGSTTCGLETE